MCLFPAPELAIGIQNFEGRNAGPPGSKAY
jgi:hypothetical protein